MKKQFKKFIIRSDFFISIFYLAYFPTGKLYPKPSSGGACGHDLCRSACFVYIEHLLYFIRTYITKATFIAFDLVESTESLPTIKIMSICISGGDFTE